MEGGRKRGKGVLLKEYENPPGNPTGERKNGMHVQE